MAYTYIHEYAEKSIHKMKLDNYKELLVVLKKGYIDSNVYFIEPLCKEGSNKKRVQKHFTGEIKKSGHITLSKAGNSLKDKKPLTFIFKYYHFSYFFLHHFHVYGTYSMSGLSPLTGKCSKMVRYAVLQFPSKLCPY